MSTVVLVHGAWHTAESWALVTAELVARGHDVRAVDLPADRPGVGTRENVDAVVAAAGADRGIVLVGHSLGGLTVPVAAQELGPRVAAMVLVAALVPRPGSSWRDRLRAEPGVMSPGFGRGQVRGEDGTTHWPPAAAADELYAGVAEECSAAAVAAAVAGLRPQDWTITREVTPLVEWPAVRTVRVVCGADRVVDAGWSRSSGAVPGAEVVEMAGGHFPMLTRPVELADLIDSVAGRPDGAGRA